MFSRPHDGEPSPSGGRNLRIEMNQTGTPGKTLAMFPIVRRKFPASHLEEATALSRVTPMPHVPPSRGAPGPSPLKTLASRREEHCVRVEDDQYTPNNN